MTHAARPEDEGRRGFALLIVLWTLVLISLVVTHLASTGRTEARIAANLMGEATAEATADGAVYETIFRLLDTSANHWAVDGTERRLKLDGGEAVIRIEPESGKINPNTASPELMEALLRTVGVDQGTAAHLAAAIADWHEPGDLPRPGGGKLEQYRAAGLDHGPPGEPFQSLDELGRVLGMTPAILDTVRPHLSLYQIGQPDPKLVDPVVAAAIRRLTPGTEPEGVRPAGIDAVTIVVEVRMTSGGRFTRRAIVRLGATFQRGYSVLEWEAVSSA